MASNLNKRRYLEDSHRQVREMTAMRRPNTFFGQSLFSAFIKHRKNQEWLQPYPLHKPDTGDEVYKSMSTDNSEHRTVANSTLWLISVFLM